MSSPHMSFRLNEYQLAKMLRILLTLEPNQPIASLSQAAKLVIIDWISTHSINAPLEVANTDIEAIKLIISLPVDQINPYVTIKQIMDQSKQQIVPNFQAQQMRQKTAQQIQREAEEERFFNESRAQALKERAEKERQTRQAQIDIEISRQMELAAQAEKRIMHKAPIERETDSIINTVTDFSPPKDWMEE